MWKKNMTGRLFYICGSVHNSPGTGIYLSSNVTCMMPQIFELQSCASKNVWTCSSSFRCNSHVLLCTYSCLAHFASERWLMCTLLCSQALASSLPCLHNNTFVNASVFPSPSMHVFLYHTLLLDIDDWYMQVLSVDLLHMSLTSWCVLHRASGRGTYIQWDREEAEAGKLILLVGRK